MPRWLEPFFIEGGVQHYLPPDILREHIQAAPGFRGALGYEWRRFRLSAESGFSLVSGTNPLVLDIALTPLFFKFGYAIPLAWGLDLTPELGLGPLFSRTGHYPTVLDMALKQKKDSRTTSFFSTLRLNLAWTAPADFISIYAGGGVDIIIETGGALPLPVFQAGISLKPFTLAAWAASRRVPEESREPVEILQR